MISRQEPKLHLVIQPEGNRKQTPLNHQKANEIIFFLILNIQSKQTVQECIDEDVNPINHSDRFALVLEQDSPMAARISSGFMGNVDIALSLGRL